jgi:glycosyltransferase involved in cell wall biosynthesis
MKLGYFLEPGAPNSNYRVIMPMLALERHGHEIMWASKLTEDVPLRTLLQCDLVHCFRRLDRTGDLKRLAAHGVAISFDNDDDLRAIDVSSGSGDRRKSGARGRFENMKKFSDMVDIARSADLMTTPSTTLADAFGSAGATNVQVIENYLDDRSMPGYGSRSKHDGLLIGWVAGREHALDLPHLSVTEALGRLLETHRDLRVLTVGTRLGLDSERYEFRKEVRFEKLIELCGGFDIGIAPLADTQFNRARSTVKLKEYAAGGTPWLASAVGPYRGLGRGEGGRLVHGDRWLDALDALIRSGFSRRLLSRNALKWAKRQTIDCNVRLWEEAFSAAIERARMRSSSSSRTIAIR